MRWFLAFKGHISMLSALNMLSSTMLKKSIPKIVFNELNKSFFGIVQSFPEVWICQFLSKHFAGNTLYLFFAFVNHNSNFSVISSCKTMLFPPSTRKSILPMTILPNVCRNIYQPERTKSQSTCWKWKWPSEIHDCLISL